MNLKEAINKITLAGEGNSRIQADTSGHKIDIRVGGVWTTVLSGVTREAAQRIIDDANNRTIMG